MWSSTKSVQKRLEHSITSEHHTMDKHSQSATASINDFTKRYEIQRRKRSSRIRVGGEEGGQHFLSREGGYCCSMRITAGLNLSEHTEERAGALYFMVPIGMKEGRKASRK